MGRSGKGRRTGRALIMQAICPAGGQHELNRAAGQVRHPVARLARAHVIGGAGHDVAIPVHLGPIRWPAEHGRRPRRGRMPSSTLLGPGGPTGVSITGNPRAHRARATAALVILEHSTASGCADTDRRIGMSTER